MTYEENSSSVKAAEAKYSKMSIENANFMFACELLGYIKSMTTKHKQKYDEIFIKIIEMIDTIRK